MVRTYTLLVELVLVAAGFVMLRLSFRRRDRLRQSAVRNALSSDVLVPDATEAESIPNSPVDVSAACVRKRPIGATSLGLSRIPSSEFAPRDIEPASEKDGAILAQPLTYRHNSVSFAKR